MSNPPITAEKIRRRFQATVAAARGQQPPPITAAQDPLLIAHLRDIADFESMRRLLAFALRPSDSCIDIGSHRGSVLAEMQRVAPLGRHIAFEPIPELADHLRREFPGVEIHQAALSEVAGESEFAHVRGEAEGWSGLKFRPLPGGGVADVEQLTVKLEVLDDVLPADFAPALIKIDVEGAELQVLRGAHGTLTRHRPTLVFEHGTGSAEVFGTHPAELHTFLTDRGYRIFDLDGNGPYALPELERAFYGGERVNWVATA